MRSRVNIALLIAYIGVICAVCITLATLLIRERPRVFQGEHVLFVGDSFTAPNPPFEPWPNILQKSMNITAIVSAVGGAGYIAIGHAPTPFPFITQVISHPEEFKAIVMFGSVNDRFAYLQVPEASNKTIHAIIDIHPNTPLLVVGPQWAGTQPIPDDMFFMRDAIATNTKGLAGVTFLDAMSAGWMVNDTTLVAGDGFHPNQLGYHRLADKIRPVLEKVLRT
jgi:hypothetical protein